MRVLWVSNDLPPRHGGIEQFVANLLERVHPDSTVVVGPGRTQDHVVYDAAQPYRIVRCGGAVLPTPRLRRLVLSVAARHRPDVVVLGASWPLGALAPSLRRHLGTPIVALSHGLEAGLVTAGAGGVLGRATRDVDIVTTISDFTERALAEHVGAARLRRLAPGVDVERFHPDVDGSRLRTSWGVPLDAPVVGCVSRLVPRKGQDALLAAWPRIQRSHPEAWLVLVGDGPSGRSLRRRVRRGGLRHVVIPGSVPWDRLPEAHAALDVFAMPCRSRLGGLDVEGLGIVYLEAQASGVPVVAGRSGGAPEAVRDGVSGTVVDGRRPGQIADAVIGWLDDPVTRAAAGDAGRRWVCRNWEWSVIAEEFTDILAEAVRRAGDRDPR